MSLTKEEFLEVLELVNTNTTHKGFDEVLNIALAHLGVVAGSLGPMAAYVGEVVADPAGTTITVNFAVASGAELDSLHISQVWGGAGAITAVTAAVYNGADLLLETLLNAEAPADGTAAAIDFSFTEYVTAVPARVTITIAANAAYFSDDMCISLNDQALAVAGIFGLNTATVSHP